MTGSPTPESAQPATLTLRTLGGVGLYGAGDPEMLLAPGKPLALLLYLALAPGRRISREFLLDLLWADLEPERARNALRQALFHLRRLLGENALPGTEELTLVRQVDTDRDQFLAAVERGDLETAVDAYTGPFLPDFGTPGGAAFERWADLERDRLRMAFLRSAELVVRRRLNESRVKDAQRLARRVRDEVPEAESAWRLLLKSIVVSRDFAAAAVEAQALENYAAAEEITLEPATRAAIARARQVTAASDDAASDATLVAELTGREREFSAITTAWDAARSGQARHVHLTAPAGLGKTRLIRDAVARLRAGGARVVELRGAPGDRDIPYAFAGDLALAIASLPGAAGIAPASASALTGLNPALSSRLPGTPDLAVGEEAHRRRIHAFVDLIQSVAYEHALVLVIDDVHWVDPSSYRVLEGIFGRLGDAHVLCLTASRPERLPAGDAASVLSLPALTPQQVGSLVAAIGSVPADASWTGDFVPGLHSATRGSPLLVLQTLRLALDQGILVLDGDGWRCADATRLAALLREAEALRHRVRALPREEGWTLAILATIGTPLPLELFAQVVGRAQPDVAATLAALERQGLVTRTDAGWIPAHDEIAEASRGALEAARQHAAERAVGTLLIGTAGADGHRLLRGVRHFVAAGDDALVRAHFRAYARQSRERHDRRPFSELGAEVFGDDATSPRVRTLVRTLPLSWRVGLWNRARQVTAVAAVVLIVAAGTARIAASTTRDAAMQRLWYADSSRSSSVIEATPSDWDGRASPVTLSAGSTPLLDAAMAYDEVQPAISPDGRSAAWNQNSGDSTTIDIWIRTPAGTRRLTNQIRDDKVIAWLPDGSGLLGVTNRWTDPAAGNYDVAIFDTATGVPRPVTKTRDHDGSGGVSPDGTRVGFIRESLDHTTKVCVVTLDAVDAPECRLPGGFPAAGVLGWTGLAELLISIDSAGTRPLQVYDWERDTRRTLVGGHFYNGRMSPDRRWVVGAVRTEGIRGFRDWIVPVDRPGNARRVDVQAAGAVRWWEGRDDRALLIDRIAFTDTSRSVLLGIGTRLGVRALTAAGAEIPMHVPVRWSSSDTAVATVDSLGDVRPRKVGSFTIEASLAGWRRVSARFDVRGAVPVTVVEERWDEQWRDRWITFGDPHPLVTRGPGGVRGFWNHGDGTYTSIGVLRRAFSARDGLGLEVRFSTPVTRDDWQKVRAILLPGVDTAALLRSDQRTAPGGAGRRDGGCGVRYPDGMGALARTKIAVTSGVGQSVEIGRDASRLASGDWWTVRVQVFPDGRCGVAVNGRVIMLSTEPLPLEPVFWLQLGDESAGTMLLHGPLKVWTGVRTDIDWMRAPPPGR